VDTQRIEQNGFQLLEQVDNTSRTVIWKALQTALDRTVIIQILKSEVSSDPAEVDHFLTTARLFARIKSDTIAAIFDIVSAEGLHYVVMEHVDGPTLDDLIDQHGPVPLDKTLRIAASLVTSLDQMWSSAHIVHRNLKSTTIRLDPRGVAKITDFSLAVVAGPGIDATARDDGNIVGTPCFLSPEQAQGARTLTTQSDMYALGAVLYHLTTGRAPFEGNDVYTILESHVKQQLPPPHRFNKKVPIAFSWFVHRLMMKNPNNRYADWDSVLHDIRLLLAGSPPSCVVPGEKYLSTIANDFSSDTTLAHAADQLRAKHSRLSGKSDQSAAYHSKRLADEHANEIRREDFLRSMVCWGVLAGWLILVFWFRAVYQVDSPSANTAFAADIDRAADPAGDIRVNADAAQPSVDSPSQPPAPAPGTAVPVVSQPTPAPSPAPVAAPTEPPSAPLPEGTPTPILDGLTQAFLNGDIQAARKIVRDAPEKFKEREALQALLDQSPAFDELVADFLRANIGKPLTFEHNGKERTVIPRGVDNGTVQLEANGRGADLPLDKLTPDEKLRWTEVPRDAPRTLAYCLLLLHSSRRDEIHARAAGCPLVSEALLQALERAPTVTPPAE